MTTTTTTTTSAAGELSDHLLRCLVCTAFEGAACYWIESVSPELPPGVTLGDFRRGGRLQPPGDLSWPWWVLVPLTPGCSLRLLDVVAAETHTIDAAKIRAALPVMAERFPDLWRQACSGDGCADAADVLIQIATHGRVVYS